MTENECCKVMILMRLMAGWGFDQAVAASKNLADGIKFDQENFWKRKDEHAEDLLLITFSSEELPKKFYDDMVERHMNRFNSENDEGVVIYYDNKEHSEH